MKKEYTSPTVKTEKVEMGVFGNYGCGNGTGGNKSYGWSWGWIFKWLFGRFY